MSGSGYLPAVGYYFLHMSITIYQIFLLYIARCLLFLHQTFVFLSHFYSVFQLLNLERYVSLLLDDLYRVLRCDFMSRRILIAIAVGFEIKLRIG